MNVEKLKPEYSSDSSPLPSLAFWVDVYKGLIWKGSYRHLSKNEAIRSRDESIKNMGGKGFSYRLRIEAHPHPSTLPRVIVSKGR